MQICVVDLQKKAETHRVGFQQIYQHYVVISIDENKAISQVPVDMYELKEKLQSPFLVLIPKTGGIGTSATGVGATNSLIMISQAEELYNGLCLVKDLAKVRQVTSAQDSQSQTKAVGFKRHSKLPGEILESFGISERTALTGSQAKAQDKTKGSGIETRFIGQLYEESVEELYGGIILEKAIIEAVLVSEKRISFRDLPAYFYCNSSLQRHLDKLLGQDKTKERFRDVVLRDPRVDDTIKEFLRNSDTDASLLI